MSDKDSAAPEAPEDNNYNHDLLACMAPHAARIIEVGCNAGALARAYRKINPACHYTGIEIDDGAAAAAGAWCDRVVAMNIEKADDSFFDAARDCEQWVFGDVLEHLVDPWGTLARIRRVLPQHGTVLACIPNVQHWSVQARINMGAFVYEQYGLFDRTHLRWFTRKTIAQMFSDAGFEVTLLAPRVFNEPDRERFLPAIRLMAQSSGTDPEEAVRDAMALQFIVRASPRA